MGKPELPVAHVEPRNLAERVEQLKGSVADTRKRVVAKHSQPVGLGTVLMSVAVVVVGCIVATLHHLHYF